MASNQINWAQDELWNAVSTRDFRRVQQLVAKGTSVNFIAPDGWVSAAGKGGRTLLHHAAWVGDPAIFMFLVENGADMNAARQRNWQRAKGFTPFQHACFYGRTEIVRYCLSKGADPNSIGEDGFTPLHLAAKYGYLPIVELLCACGVRPNPLNKGERTPLDLAANEEVRARLANYGCLPSTKVSAASRAVPVSTNTANVGGNVGRSFLPAMPSSFLGFGPSSANIGPPRRPSYTSAPYASPDTPPQKTASHPVPSGVFSERSTPVVGGYGGYRRRGPPKPDKLATAATSLRWD